MAAIVDEIYYGCKTNYVEKCVKQGIKIINIFSKQQTGINIFSEFNHKLLL